MKNRLMVCEEIPPQYCYAKTMENNVICVIFVFIAITTLKNVIYNINIAYHV